MKERILVVDDNPDLRELAEAILKKQVTSTELYALDPDNPEIGINFTPSFKEILDDSLR